VEQVVFAEPGPGGGQRRQLQLRGHSAAEVQLAAARTGAEGGGRVRAGSGIRLKLYKPSGDLTEPSLLPILALEAGGL
jgi:hypothetical protein